MTYIINIIGIILVGAVGKTFLENPHKALALSLLLIVSEYGIYSFNYNFVAKCIMICCAIFCLNFRLKKSQALVFCLMICILGIGVHDLSKFSTATYGFTDMITSYATIVLGILITMVEWRDEERTYALKVMSWIPIFCVVCGIIYYQNLFLGGRIVTIGLFSHLPFWGGLGYVASVFFSELTENTKYMKLALFDLAIVFFTSSRGGMLFVCILFAPYLIKKIKHLSKRVISKFIFLLPIIVSVFAYAIVKLFEKTFSTGELNTSNRLLAWEHLLRISADNRMFGLGLGSLKTVTNDKIIGMGFNAAHNEYIRFIYETGIVGLSIILIILFVVFKKFLNNFFVFRKKGFAIALIMGFVIYSITDNTISAIQFWGPFTMVLSLGMKNKGYWRGNKWSA